LIAAGVGGSDEEMTATQEAAEKMNVVTSAGGLAGLACSGGDWKAGEQGATLEAAGTFALGNGDAAVRMNVLGIVGDVLDKAETTLKTANIIDPPH
jgi:hypothetical protein